MPHDGFAPQRATAEDALATPALHGGDRRFDLVTLTPPYEEVSYADLADRVAESPLLNDDCVVVFEYPVELGSLPPKLGSRDQLVPRAPEPALRPHGPRLLRLQAHGQGAPGPAARGVRGV